MSALDVLVQNGSSPLQRPAGASWASSYLFITHDLAVTSARPTTSGIVMEKRQARRGPTRRLGKPVQQLYRRGLRARELIEAVPGRNSNSL